MAFSSPGKPCEANCLGRAAGHHARLDAEHDLARDFLLDLLLRRSGSKKGPSHGVIQHVPQRRLKYPNFLAFRVLGSPASSDSSKIWLEHAMELHSTYHPGCGMSDAAPLVGHEHRLPQVLLEDLQTSILRSASATSAAAHTPPRSWSWSVPRLPVDVWWLWVSVIDG